MKTLLLNPPSFPNFDGGASSRWPASREIASFWYPVWLSYPAGLIKDSRLLDAPPHGVTPDETVEISKQYDFVTLYTSTPGFKNDVRLAEMMKAAKPDLKLAFVGLQYANNRLAASEILSTEGSIAISSGGLKGTGTSSEATRITGASRCSNASSEIRAAISAPNPAVMFAS